MRAVVFTGCVPLSYVQTERHLRARKAERAKSHVPKLTGNYSAKPNYAPLTTLA